MVDQSMQNVGTVNNPVSWLHQRTVALLYDELTRADGTDDEVRVRLTPDGEMSGNLSKGVAKVKIPGEWDSVGGVVPDLILYADDDTPVRIIEVIVSSPPTAAKRKKLDSLRRRGVDVVEIKVTAESDLVKLCWQPRKLIYGWRTPGERFSVNIAANEHKRGQVRDLNKTVMELTRALQSCSPQVRRDFWHVLRNIGTLDSLYPVRRDNPLAESLNRDGMR